MDMDMAMESWISELEMDDYLIDIDQYTNISDEFEECVQHLSTPDDNYHHSSSPESQAGAHNSASTTTFGGSSVEIYRSSFERPPKKIHVDTAPDASMTNEQVNHNSDASFNEVTNKNLNGENKKNCAPKTGQKRPNALIRAPVETQDRVMAERKRREKLSQRFIALSAMIPGLKKMDKASVLGDAIKYLNQLQENVKTLEEKINKKASEESVLFVKKSQMFLDDDTSSCDENFDGHLKEALPEIEARISEKFVLIRIHCGKQKGFFVKLLTEIEKLRLNVVNSRFLPFGQYAVDITVVAEMEAEFSMTVKMLVKNLRSSLMKFM